MIPDGPVERYLSELRRRLPYPAPRLVAETREHLVEATTASIAAGLQQEEAERRAVQEYGPVGQVVAAVLSEGSGLMSPALVRWIVPLAMLLVLPTAIFVAVNLIERLAGSDGSEGVFGTIFDSWGSQINALLVLGPVVALSLIVVSSVRVHRERGSGGFAATIEVRMSRARFWAAAFVAVISAGVIGYGLIENWGTYNEFVNQNWTCTIEEGRQVCYEGTS